MKKYRFGFDIWALVLFLAIMLPNFYWFAVPAPNDVLRAESETAALDAVASVCQILMLTALCTLIRRDSKKYRLDQYTLGAGFFCGLYYIAWLFYYQGYTGWVVIASQCILPCAAFGLYALGRKNYIAMIPLGVFAVCHTIFGVVNFIV